MHARQVCNRKMNLEMVTPSLINKYVFDILLSQPAIAGLELAHSEVRGDNPKGHYWII